MVGCASLTTWFWQDGTGILLILVVAVTSYLVITRAVRRAMRRSLAKTMHDRLQEDIEKREKAFNRLFQTTCGLIITAIAILLVLAELGINSVALVGAFGGVAIAVGFATRNLVRDLVTGAFIAIENQYNVGDVIRVAGVTGMVEAINFRKTTLSDGAGTLHHIANREIRSSMNLSKMSSTADMDICVPRKEDVDQVMSTIRTIWEEMAGDPEWRSSVVSTTPWVVRADGSEASRILIRVVGETKPGKQCELADELRRRIEKVYGDKWSGLRWYYPKQYFGKN